MQAGIVWGSSMPPPGQGSVMLPTLGQPHALPWLLQSRCTHACAFSRLCQGLAALLGCFHSWTCDHWEPILERKSVPLGRCVAPLRRGPFVGAWFSAQRDFSLTSFWSGAEVFCEVSSCSCLQTFLCPLFKFHSDNQGG